MKKISKPTTFTLLCLFFSLKKKKKSNKQLTFWSILNENGFEFFFVSTFLID